MKNCIKEANKEFMNDIKKRCTKTNMIIAGAILFFVVEFIIIVEILETYVPTPPPFVGIPIALLICVFIIAQVSYTVHLFTACNKKDKS